MEETLPAVALLKILVLVLLLVSVLLVPALVPLVPVLLMVPMMTLLVLLPVLLLVGALAAAGVAAPTRSRRRRVAQPAAEGTAAALDLPQAGEIHQAMASCSSAATSSDQDVCQQLNVMRLQHQDVPKVKAGPPRLHACSMNVG